MAQYNIGVDSEKVKGLLVRDDGFYQQTRGGFSARREYWNAIRASFRLLLFESRDQMLERINSPPQPAFN